MIHPTHLGAAGTTKAAGGRRQAGRAGAGRGRPWEGAYRHWGGLFPGPLVGRHRAGTEPGPGSRLLRAGRGRDHGGQHREFRGRSQGGGCCQGCRELTPGLREHLQVLVCNPRRFLLSSNGRRVFKIVCSPYIKIINFI